jgi:hypothetical protein
MTTERCAIAAWTVSVILVVTATAQDHLLPIRDSDKGQWGWRLKLFPDAPAGDGCSESWNTGIVRGGAFIEQSAGF